MSIRLNRIYTRGGDKGTTALIGGKRVPKSSLRLECYGTADELNAIVGIIRTENERAGLAADDQQALGEDLALVQNHLFDIGSLLAVDPESEISSSIQGVCAEHVAYLEKQIDTYNEHLSSLSSFTLPGGCPLNAYAHLARTVCRRLERVCYQLHEKEPVDSQALSYINRLSDYFFVLSRWVSQKLGASEYLWQQFKRSDTPKQR